MCLLVSHTPWRVLTHEMCRTGSVFVSPCPAVRVCKCGEPVRGENGHQPHREGCKGVLATDFDPARAALEHSHAPDDVQSVTLGMATGGFDPGLCFCLICTIATELRIPREPALTYE